MSRSCLESMRLDSLLRDSSLPSGGGPVDLGANRSTSTLSLQQCALSSQFQNESTLGLQRGVAGQFNNSLNPVGDRTRTHVKLSSRGRDVATTRCERCERLHEMVPRVSSGIEWAQHRGDEFGREEGVRSQESLGD